MTFQMGFVGINTPYLMVQHIVRTETLPIERGTKCRHVLHVKPFSIINPAL